MYDEILFIFRPASIIYLRKENINLHEKSLMSNFLYFDRNIEIVGELIPLIFTDLALNNHRWFLNYKIALKMILDPD